MEENIAPAVNDKKDVINEFLEPEQTDTEIASVDESSKKNVDNAETSLTDNNEDNLDATSKSYKDEKSNELGREKCDEVESGQNEDEQTPLDESEILAVKPTEQASSGETNEINNENTLNENETESIIVEDNENDQNQECVSDNATPPVPAPIVTQPSASVTSEIPESNEPFVAPPAVSQTSNSSLPKKNADTPSKANKPSPADSVNIISSDPDTIRLKFLFANRDGLNVNVECKITDSVGEIKGVLLSMWPEDLSPCSEGDRIRLICMGKGILMPDGKSLKDCEIPIFDTHATPINVSVKPDYIASSPKMSLLDGNGRSAFNNANLSGSSSRNGDNGVSQGCYCLIL